MEKALPFLEMGATVVAIPTGDGVRLGDLPSDAAGISHQKIEAGDESWREMVCPGVAEVLSC